jgi:hypothetical protein
MAAAHVDHLSGSELAKLRLSLILRTMTGEISVAEACTELHVCESRFHALRTNWLQDAIELLEPRPIGRPPKADNAESARIEELEALVRALECQLDVSRTSEEVARILVASAASDPRNPPKKRDVAAARKEGRRQLERQRVARS